MLILDGITPAICNEAFKPEHLLDVVDALNAIAKVVVLGFVDWIEHVTLL
jgi:hypothetical protein